MIQAIEKNPILSPLNADTNYNGANTEFTFLLDCAKSFLKPESYTLSEVSLAAIHWPQLEQLIHVHRLLPVVHHALQSNNLIQPLPTQAAKALIAKQQQMVWRSLSLSINTLKLLETFHLNGIRALPLKGALLGLQIYDNLALRTPGDIDLLVDTDQSDRALSILKDLGYRWPLAKEWSPTQQKLYIAQQGEISCISTETGISIDLHFRWSGNAQLFPLPFEQAWESATHLPVSSAHTPRVLCLEHQLLYLSTHGAKHYWERLSWLLDIAMLMQQSVDWEIVIAEAKRLGIRRPVSQAIALASELLNIDRPRAWIDSEKALNERDRMAITWLTTVARKTLQDRSHKSTTPHLNRPPVVPFAMVNQLRYRMKLKPSVSYKLTCIQPLLISPKDWQVLALPEPLWFLYILLRPVFYVWRTINSSSASETAHPKHPSTHHRHNSRSARLRK